MFNLSSVLETCRVPQSGLAVCTLAVVAMSTGCVLSGRMANAQETIESARRQGGVIRVADDTNAKVSVYRSGVSARLSLHLRRTSGDRVFFGPGSSKLGSNARIVLSAQARWMKLRPAFGALISGYADDPGSSEDNRRLANERADAVRQRLVDEGISANRIVIEALGRREPIAVCRSSQCAAQNRRVVTRVLFELPSPAFGRTVPDNNKLDERVSPHRGASLVIP